MRAAIVLFVLALAGCESGPPHDVQYYIDNPAERIELLKRCENDVRRAIEPNCENASRAAIKAMFSGSGMPSVRQ